jgi:hypothetical protein
MSRKDTGASRRRVGRRLTPLIACIAAAALAPAAPAHAASCDAPANAIVAENCKPGAPPGEWDLGDADNGSIQGFTTSLSVAPGERVDFKIDTPSTNYRLDIYRMGYYGGDGARKVGTVEHRPRRRGVGHLPRQARAGGRHGSEPRPLRRPR